MIESERGHATIHRPLGGRGLLVCPDWREMVSEDGPSRDTKGHMDAPSASGGSRALTPAQARQLGEFLKLVKDFMMDVHRLSYADIGKASQLPEGTIRRIFNQEPPRWRSRKTTTNFSAAVEETGNFPQGGIARIFSKIKNGDLPDKFLADATASIGEPNGGLVRLVELLSGSAQPTAKAEAPSATALAERIITDNLNASGINVSGARVLDGGTVNLTFTADQIQNLMDVSRMVANRANEQNRRRT